ncbi:MAG: hypothetical protein KAY32_01345 [Candidatus Eisenbacteria sp.]|nr:hypothetical protein [Candidatus Eisenbacteria bacterium]
MGGGTWPAVQALELYDGDLIAGGWFEQAGGVGASYVARWDGSAWSALAGGLNYWVHSLESHDGDLIVGGEFTSADEIESPNLARWDGGQWHAFGAGTDGWVEALQTHGIDLYVGGRFATAGSQPSYYVARWQGTDPAAIPDRPALADLKLTTLGANPFRGTARLGFYLAAPAAVCLTIHDASGRLIDRLLDQRLCGGWHEVAWSRSLGGRAAAASAGVYFARLGAGEQRVTHRLVRIE